MKRSDEPAAYMRKAERTLAAARTLLRDEDSEGACNRAYYAMFNATHAALRAAGIAAPEGGYKSHGGLIGAFGKHLVLGARVDRDLGRALNEVQRLRQIADYIGDPPSLDDATRAVQQAEVFVTAMRARL